MDSLSEEFKEEIYGLRDDIRDMCIELADKHAKDLVKNVCKKYNLEYKQCNGDWWFNVLDPDHKHDTRLHTSDIEYDIENWDSNVSDFEGEDCGITVEEFQALKPMYEELYALVPILNVELTYNDCLGDYVTFERI